MVTAEEKELVNTGKWNSTKAEKKTLDDIMCYNVQCAKAAKHEQPPVTQMSTRPL